MKTLFVLASVIAVLFLAAPNKVEAQKRKAARVIEGTISDFECGDNCYLTIADENGKEHTGLCSAPLCTSWVAEQMMPESYKGKRVKVTIGKEKRFDGAGNLVDTADAFTQIQLLTAPPSISAQKRNATKTIEGIVNAYLRQRVTSESGGALLLASFRKTNGYEKAYGVYVIEWQADISVLQDIWKGGDLFVGYFQDFRVMTQDPGYSIGQRTVKFNKGTTIQLIGDATLRKTEQGWRLEGFTVKGAQVAAGDRPSHPRPPVAGRGTDRPTPSANVKLPEQLIRQLAKDDSKETKSCQLCGGGGDFEIKWFAENLSTRLLDLNTDGKPEWILSYCGNHACSLDLPEGGR